MPTFGLSMVKRCSVLVGSQIEQCDDVGQVVVDCIGFSKLLTCSVSSSRRLVQQEPAV